MTGSANTQESMSYIFEVPDDMMVCYIRLLKRGPEWTPEEMPEVARLQAAHVTYGRQLLASGKLILNGPVIDNGDLRGVGVFRSDSLEEARALSDADPSVQAGRLVSYRFCLGCCRRDAHRSMNAADSPSKRQQLRRTWYQKSIPG